MRRSAAVTVAVAAVGAGLLSGCAADQDSPLHYRTDARLSTYNAASATGNSDGVLMAFTRVQGGFSVLGPQGQVISDRDVGTVELAPGPTLTLQYTFSPKAVYSDGAKMTCDDLVLAWVAQSGRFRGFDAATTAGYRDIDRVECMPGAQTAKVRFANGRSYRDWRGLFGAGSMLPAHVVAKDAGVTSVVDAVRTRNAPALTAIAKSWNTGFALPSGQLDAKRFLSSGPYRAESFDQKTGLRLVRNDKWWGAPATLATIIVYGRNTDTAARTGAGGFEVADATAGLTEPAAGAEPPQVSPASGALSTEQIVIAHKGALAPLPARQAFASCVPRDALARAYGYGSQPWNLHVLTPASDLADPINGQFGQRYARADVVRARELVKQRPPSPTGAPAPPLKVRLGYLGPDARRKKMVSDIADSCRRAGIEVVDAASPDVAATALRTGALDAVLLNTGASFAAAGAADVVRDAYGLFRGDPLNLGDFGDPMAADAVTKFSVTTVAGDQLAQSRAMETAAWRDVAAIPLFATPREQKWDTKLTGVVAGRARNGTGWNMDRWARQ
ncbi:MAG: ABC transporter substrate-binding protein [Gordonia sp. (in: high G+C Gram-positive bacteria)]